MSGLLGTDCRHVINQEDAPCCSFSRNFWSFTNCACVIVWTVWYEKDVVLQCLLLSISVAAYCQRTSTFLGSLALVRFTASVEILILPINDQLNFDQYLVILHIDLSPLFSVCTVLELPLNLNNCVPFPPTLQTAAR